VAPRQDGVTKWFYQEFNPLIVLAGEIRVLCNGSGHIFQMWYTECQSLEEQRWKQNVLTVPILLLKWKDM